MVFELRVLLARGIKIKDTDYILFQETDENDEQSKKLTATHSSPSENSSEVQIVAASEVMWLVGKPLITEEGLFASCAPIDPKDIHFLHPAILCLKPTLGIEPFIFFGVNVKCGELEEIHALGKPDKPFKHIEVCTSAVSLNISFLHDLHMKWVAKEGDKYKYTRKAILQELIMSIRHARKGSKRAKFDKKLKKHFKNNKSSRSLIRALIKYSNVYSYKDVQNEDEAHLQEFVIDILNLDGSAKSHVNQRMHLFKKHYGEVLACVPDANYLPDILDGELSENSNGTSDDSTGNDTDDDNDTGNKADDTDDDDTDDDDIVTGDNDAGFIRNHQSLPAVVVELDGLSKQEMVSETTESGNRKEGFNAGLVWKIFEQLLATLLSNKGIESKKEILSQGGLLIVDNMVRSVVLHMHNDVYKELRNYMDVKKTLAYIRNHKVEWCSLFLEKSEHRICNVLERAKLTYYNFNEN